MNIRRLLSDDEQAVSPVIGVILMVAITVILAAVIATFVLGLGEQVSDTAPQASFSFNPSGNGGYGAIIMDSGSELDGNNIKVQKGDGSVIAGASDTSNGYVQVPTSITAGTDLLSGISTDAFDSDTTVKIIWTSPSGQDSATIASYNA